MKLFGILISIFGILLNIFIINILYHSALNSNVFSEALSMALLCSLFYLILFIQIGIYLFFGIKKIEENMIKNGKKIFPLHIKVLINFAIIIILYLICKCLNFLILYFNIDINFLLQILAVFMYSYIVTSILQIINGLYKYIKSKINTFRLNKK